MKKALIAFLSVILTAVSCVNYEHTNGEQPVARVHNTYLYPSDLTGILPQKYTRTDSIRIVEDYIRKWVKTQLILNKAETNLTQTDLEEIRRQLEHTRASLTIYKYEQEMMRQKMDTTVTAEEIRLYYGDHSENFILDRSIVKATYIKIPDGAPNLEKVRTWYRSEKEEDQNSLESYCYQYASKFDHFDDDWIAFGEILNQLPGEVRNEESFLRYNTSIEMRDSSHHYFVAIRDYQLAGSEAPVEFVDERIRNIILNKRKVTFIRELENSVYNEGLTKNKFEIFTP
ncbi:MAG: hypothetical protein ACP5D1_07025 [Bacteroidales bacterium]